MALILYRWVGAMETDEPLVDGDGVKSESTSVVKEKKKKLKAIYRKRALSNLSFRNAAC